MLMLVGLAAPSFARERSTLQWLAGDPGSEGNLDGPAVQARFAGSLSLSADRDGGVLVGDGYANTVRRIAADGMVTTLAGSGGAKGLRDGRGDAVRFDSPAAMVRSGDGRLLVADAGNNAIRVIAVDGSVSTLQLRAGPSLASPADAVTSAPDGDAPLLEAPQRIALDGAGRLWVADRYQGRVSVIDIKDGRVRSWPAAAQLVIKDLASAADGRIWAITDHQVLRLRDDGVDVVAERVVPDWSPPAAYAQSPPPDGPVAALQAQQVPSLGRGPLPPVPAIPAERVPPSFTAMAFDAHGNLYVAEPDRVHRLDHGSASLRTVFNLDAADVAAHDSAITSIAVDGRGRVLVAGAGEAVYEVTGDGRLRLHAGLPPRRNRLATIDPQSTPALPSSLDDTAIVQRDGGLLLLDKLDHGIWRLDARGAGALWAGGDDVEGAADGPRLQARFNYPADMVVDRDGGILVADGGNARIRRIDRSGTVTTIAGTVSAQERRDGAARQASFWRPERIALDPAGILYVVDNSPYIGGGGGGARLRRIDLARGVVTTIAPPRTREAFDLTPAQLEAMLELGDVASTDYRDIAVGPKGLLYALATNAVWRIDPASGRHTLLFQPADDPRKLRRYAARAARQATDASDELDNHLISCDWAWCYPDDIAVDDGGHVYVSDGGSHTVLRIDPDGRAGVIAGQLGRRGNRDGALPGALDRPGGLGFNPDGDLMINVDDQGVMLLRHPSEAPMQVEVPAIH